jgi:hypothetical protein
MAFTIVPNDTGNQIDRCIQEQPQRTVTHLPALRLED